MILIACPNPSLDRTIEVPRLEPGHVHRATAVDVRGGGKGVNVARALACIGSTGRVVALLGGRIGDVVHALLADEGIDTIAVSSTGETRSCITALGGASATVFNEPGPSIDAATWARFEEAVAHAVEPESVFVCSGSFPLGAPPDAAARLIALARERGAITICDTSGAQLERALAAGPNLITPNLAEAQAVLEGAESEPMDSGTDAVERAAAAAVALRERGPAAVLVTVGAAGAALAQRSGTTTFAAPPVELCNPVGAGDCLVAGIAYGLAASEELAAASRRGIAMAAASCETFPAGLLDPARAEWFLNEWFATAAA